MLPISHSMEILHISDLHITEKYESLTNIWLKADEPIKNKKFDFIVISGDLTQSASSREYGLVARFIEKYLLDKLKISDRSRVIIVPGNHDVCWKTSDESFQPLTAKKNSCKWREALCELQELNPNSKFRSHHNEKGFLSILEIGNSSAYRDRFRNFQFFYDDFYQGIELQHRFVLNDYEEQGNDFSIHEFINEKIIFVGFNSCHRNDSKFRGAAINSKAIAKCRDIFNKYREDNFLIIGVWHHGLRSQKGSLDYLEISEVLEYQLASDKGCHIGLHGHTHVAEQKEIRKINPNIFVFGAGSLCAGDRARPGAVGKQFSTIEIQRNQISNIVYELKNNSFSRSDERCSEHVFDSRDFNANQTIRPNIEVDKDVRKWIVRSDGLANINVELSGMSIEGESEIPLATIMPPYGTSIVENNVDCSSGESEVKHCSLPEGHTSYFLVNEKLTKNIDWMQWSYTVSNRISLNESDIKYRENRFGFSSTVREDEEVIGHIVNFKTKELVIECNFPKKIYSALKVGRTRVVAEKAFIFGGALVWREVEFDHKNFELQLDEKKNKLSLLVHYPCVGYRYSVIFSPTGESWVSSTESDQLLADVIERCSRGEAGGFGEQILDYIEGVFEKRNLGGLSGIEVAGYFWVEERKRLETFFGRRMPRFKWGKSFKYGLGLAGYSFRFNEVALYHKSDARSSIFIPMDNESYAWMICIPIFPVFPSNAKPIGVVSFASSFETDENGLASQMCFQSRFCCENRDIFSNNGVTRTEHELEAYQKRLEFNKLLCSAVNIGFWNYLETIYTGDLQSYIKKNLDALES